MLLKHGKKLLNLNSLLWRPSFYRKLARQMSNSAEVLFEEFGNKGVITLNRPKALNALNLNMIRMIYPKLKEWEKIKTLVVIKGCGEKAFCAGGDVLSVTKEGKEGGTLPKEFFREEYFLNCLIGTYHIPYVALIDGITMGGGVGLSVHGQYRVATDRSMFAMPETAIGLFPDVGGSYFLPRLGGNLGMYLALTGYRLKGRDLQRAGIATHLCDSSRLAELQETLLNLTSTYQEDIANTIQEFNDSATFGKDKEFSLKSFTHVIQECFRGSSVEEIIKNLEANGSEWAQKQVALISKMSPTSLKITFEALKRGEHLTFQECLSMEYRLTQRCCADHDFYEGVRAVLIDRDDSPKWKPDNLSEVTEEVIQKYFSLLPSQDELIF